MKSARVVLTLSQDGLLALIAEHVASVLSPEVIEAIAERAIAERVGMLTLEQAARHLQCRNLRQLTDFCRQHRIPVEHFGAKKRFIRLGEIEAAQKRARLAIAPETTATGTTVARVGESPRKERTAA